MDSITHNAAPNVVPGTNFNNQRFQEMFAWISATAADAARSTMQANQYGLLIPFDGKTALQLEQKENLLTLRRCAAITARGRIIGVFENITPILETNLSEYTLDPKMQYHILVEVKTGKQQAFGPSTEDLPLRPQFAMPDYALHVQASDQSIGQQTDALPIGLLNFQSGAWELIKYIPPCAQIGASDFLRERYRNYKEELEVILAAQPNIIRQTDTFRDKAMIELREFAMQCGSYLATQRPELLNLSESGSPFQLVKNWMSFANLVSFLLNCLTDRSGFYNLLYINTRSVNGVMLTTERLDRALFNLTSQNYQHQDILNAINAVDEFLALIVPMFKALGNGTLRPTGNKFEDVYKTPVVESRKTSSTW